MLLLHPSGKTLAMDLQDRQPPMAVVYHFLRSNMSPELTVDCSELRMKIYISFTMALTGKNESGENEDFVKLGVFRPSFIYVHQKEKITT